MFIRVHPWFNLSIRQPREFWRRLVRPRAWALGMGVAMTALTLRSQTAEEFALPVSESVGATAAPEEVTYREADRDDHGFNRSLTSISVPTLTVYRAANPAHRHSAVILCPGGGYDHLAIDPAGHGLARYFQQQGLTAAVLKYRLPKAPLANGAIPLSQQDALAALTFLRHHAAAWGIDADRIGIVGSSSGGHLAGSAAIFGRRDEDSRPAFAVLLSPVVTLAGPSAHVGSRDHLLGKTADAVQMAAYSLEQQVRPGLPPFFLVHALDDTVVPPENSRMLAAALKRQSVPCELLLVPTGGHGFTAALTPAALVWKESFLHWLDALP